MRGKRRLFPEVFLFHKGLFDQFDLRFHQWCGVDRTFFRNPAFFHCFVKESVCGKQIVRICPVSPMVRGISRWSFWKKLEPGEK